MIAQQFIEQGFPVNLVLSVTKLPKSSFYYVPSGGKKGKTPSQLTYTTTGTCVSNSLLVKQMEDLIQEEEFVDYGYIKFTYWLRLEHQYIINFKKVYRLMKENRLLLPVIIKRNRSGKTWISDRVPHPKQPFEFLEFDIKYIYIHGARRNALLLSVIDVHSRWLLGWSLQWSIKKEEVKALFQVLLEEFPIPQKVTVRNDNGSQFESNLIRTFLAENNIIQEFTRPATPQQNGHIESYHSILERVICRKYEFESLVDAQHTFQRFEYFYNFKRIHSGVDYKSPYKFLLDFGIGMKHKRIDSINDFSLRGWRLETSANKQVFEE